MDDFMNRTVRYAGVLTLLAMACILGGCAREASGTAGRSLRKLTGSPTRVVWCQDLGTASTCTPRATTSG